MYDLRIKNCKIIDGTGAPWYSGSVAIKDGHIAKIERSDGIEEEKACETVDAKGLYLSPGFIDIHSHSDTSLMEYPKAESRIFQGVTTEIGGNCGMSVAPVSKDPKKEDELKAYMGEMTYDWNRIGEFLDKVQACGPSVNFGTIVGHGTLRIAAMGFENRKADAEEMNTMKSLLKESLEDGAFAMSSGLIYPPGCYADTEELAELAKVLPSFDAFYATHMREEGAKVVDSVKEAIEICRRSGASLEISHHKVVDKKGWRTACRETTALIEEARESGLDVWADQYPYCASSTTMDSNIPKWAFEGGMEKLFQRLKDPKTRAKLMKKAMPAMSAGGAISMSAM